MSEYEVRPLPRVSRHATCPTCNHLATLLVNADACPLLRLGYDGCYTGRLLDGTERWHTCADEDTADCAARIVAWEEEK